MNPFLKKKDLEEELEAIKVALAMPEYSEAYAFEYKAALNGKDFELPFTKEIVEACNQAEVHFLPDNALQMAEMEIFNRYKKIIERHLEGKSIALLMNFKNDVERKMLKDQLLSATDRLGKVNEMIASIELKEAPADDGTVVDIAPKKPKGKK